MIKLVLPMPEGHVSLLAAFNAHTRLVVLLQKIVRKVYPIKVQSKDDKWQEAVMSRARARRAAAA